MVRLQNPPLIVMLCLLISLVFLFSSLNGLPRMICLIVLMAYIVFFMYKLIWFVKYRKNFFALQLTEHSIKIADKEYPLDEVKEIIFFENYLQIRCKSGRKLIYYIIKKEEKLDLISGIKEVTEGKNIPITMR